MKIEQFIVPQIITALPGSRISWVVVWWLVGVALLAMGARFFILKHRVRGTSNMTKQH